MGFVLDGEEMGKNFYGKKALRGKNKLKEWYGFGISGWCRLSAAGRSGSAPAVGLVRDGTLGEPLFDLSVAQRLRRLVWDQEFAGSSPARKTI